MQEKKPNHALSAMKCPVTLEDVDLFSPGAPEHWYEAYDILHEQAPVHRLPGEGFAPGTDGFVLSRYEDVARVVRDEERYPPALSALLKQYLADERDPTQITELNTMMASMLTLRPNPALWRTHRQELTDPWVGPGSGRHEAMITELTHQLIDDWIERGSVNFVAEFAVPLPQMVMARVLGWPMQDLGLLKHFGDGTVQAFVHGSGHRSVLANAQLREQAQVLKEFKAYTDDLIAQRRAQPEEDMITFLTEVEYSPLGRRLNDLEVNGIVYAMVIGGLETTQYALSEQVQLLIENPDAWAQLKADRSKIRNFTEEAMRLRSPTQGLSTRTTSQDEIFQGVEVAAGSFLHMRWAAANIDPMEWGEDAKQLNLDRKAVSRHLAFSQGARVCPGATLSRLEQTIAWQILLDRVAAFRYADGNDFLHQPGIMLGTQALHLEFDRA